MGNRRFYQIEHRVDVYLEGQLPLFVADILDGLESRLMGGVVYENIDPIEMRDGFLYDAAAMGCRLDIARNQKRLSTGLFDKRFVSFASLSSFKYEMTRSSAFARKRDRNARPMPLSAPVMTAFFTGQTAGALVRSLAMIRLRIHQSGNPRHRLLLGSRCLLIHGRLLRRRRAVLCAPPPVGPKTHFDRICSRCRGNGFRPKFPGRNSGAINSPPGAASLRRLADERDSPARQSGSSR